MHKVRPEVGSAPGTLVLPKGSPPPVIHLTCYREDQLDERVIDDPRQLEAYLKQDRVLWVDVQGLGSEEILTQLAEIFNIHPLALEDIVHVPQRPKTETYDEHQLLFTRMLTGGKDGKVGMEQISMVIGSDYIVTFQERPGDVLQPVRHRLHSPNSRVRTHGADFLAYALLDTIVDAYSPVIERLGDTIAELEDQVYAGHTKGALEQISDIRSTLLSVRRSIWPLRDAVSQLARNESQAFKPDVSVYLRDVYDHCVNAADMVETYRELASSLMNAYLSVVSHRMNEVMKVLTVMSTIFIPLTFFTGLYGMNFHWIPELQWKWSYPILLGVMAAMTVGLLVYFHRKGWLGSSET